MPPYWARQTKEQPLHPNLIWGRPEQRATAGKLLIVGGHAGGFSAPAEAYQAAEKAGIGQCRILLPDSLKKTLGQSLSQTEFAPSTPNGSFSAEALADLIDLSRWADAVMLAGDFGRNLETAGLLEKFILKYLGPFSLTGDSLDFFTDTARSLLERSATLLVPSLSQLQKLARSSRFEAAFTSDLELLALVERLHGLSQRIKPAILYQQAKTSLVAFEGRVSSTEAEKESNLVELTASATVWWLQNQADQFASVSTSLVGT